MNSLKAISRRDFLALLGGASALGLSYLILRPQPAFASVLPPGARTPFALFHATCLRCGKCTAACPHQAIRQDAQGLPYVDGLGGWCDFCMDCVAVCPTGALHPIDPKTAYLGVAVLNQDRCIAWIRSGCRLCYEKCLDLQKAITVDAKMRPAVDPARCNGCGACVYVCPQADIEGRSREFGKAIALNHG
jgi:ferredoxin-type protein NapG